MKSCCEKMEEKLDQGSRWLHWLVESRLFKKISPNLINLFDMFWCSQLDRLERLISKMHFSNSSSTDPLNSQNDFSTSPSTSPEEGKFFSAISQWLDYFVTYFMDTFSNGNASDSQDETTRKKRKTINSPLELRKKKPPFSLRRSNSNLNPSSSLPIIAITNNSSNNCKITSKIQKGFSQNGAKLVNQYVLLNTIGEGTSKVKLCYNQEDYQYYAVKIFDKERLMKHKVSGTVFPKRMAYDCVLREIEILQRVNHHPNIVSLIEIMNDPQCNKLYTVLEYVPQGSLAENISRFTDLKFLKKSFREICSGLEFIHSRNIIHRDIKPDNLLLAPTGVKITDFGVAIMIESNNDPSLRTTVGTPAFLPPELCSVDTPSIIGSALDIWSLGVTLYYLVFAKLPFVNKSKNQLELFRNISTKPVVFPHPISSDLRDLILKLLIKDPKKRITLKEIYGRSWLK